MRALLVVNPQATGTTAGARDVLAAALAADLKVEVAETQRRGHATDLAREAASDEVDLVVALGGDGTVNEVVNGLMDGGPRPAGPALGIVPGGCTNVLARSLGLPTDAVEATAVLLEQVRTGHTRTIGLGVADDRWFTFCAGLGIDAGTIQRVEHKRTAGSRVTPWRYFRGALAEYAFHTDRGHPALRLAVPGAGEVPAAAAFVCNTSPWTYLGDRPVDPCPEASFDEGLDICALGSLRLPAALRASVELFGRGPHGRKVVTHHDLSRFVLRSATPVPFQVDGDYVGDVTQVRFTAVPRALRVLAPAA